MNKFLKLFCGAAVLTTMAACSSDEPNVGPNGPEGNGEVAYMKVQITAPATRTRATTDGGYTESDATELEHKVSGVSFLFFEKNGAYAFTVKADDSTFQPADGNGSNSGNANVEYIGKDNIVVLEGVTQNNYPEYMMTILNCPSDFTPGQTMQETADRLTTFANDFKDGAATPFVMTTSSFYGARTGQNGGARHDDMYYVTKLNSTDFKTTLDEAKTTADPVEIYVERLAAKVQVGISGAEGRFETWNGEKYFKLNQTLAGGNDVTTGDNVSDVDLYVKVEGWGLNTLASQSYMSKKLDEAWKTTDVYTGWNNSNDWRSFWGVAHTYGAYDQSKFTYKTPKEIYGNGQAFSEDLKNNTEYCYENTNAPVNIFTAVTDGPFTLSGAKVGVENARVTHVVLRTKIYQKNSDGSFATLDDLVQYRGILYTGDSFKALVLNSLKAAGNLNFWRYKGSSADPTTDVITTNWQSISANDVEMVKNTDADHKLGEIKVVAKALAAGDKIYQRTVVKEDDKDVVKYVDITSTYKNTLDGLLDAVYSNYNPVGTDTADAIYYIPIEHNATALVQGTPTEAKEAFYGVVRNHWYKLTVNSFKKVGHLVFDPENDTTQIIPDKPEDPLYYVGAKINILSWKVINQSINDL